MDIALIKTIHVGCAALSIAGFGLRAAGKLLDAAWVKGKIARIAPHVVDTVLLASALLLAYQLGFAPWRDGWLAAKILALFGYIGLGLYGMRFARTRRQRFIAFLLAVMMFLYIVAVARTHLAWPFG
jgi:uncharacterized membrane protein SirB2